MDNASCNAPFNFMPNEVLRMIIEQMLPSHCPQEVGRVARIWNYLAHTFPNINELRIALENSRLKKTILKKYYDNELNSNKAFTSILLKNNILNYSKVIPELKNNPNIIRESIIANPPSFYYVPKDIKKEFKTDRELFLSVAGYMFNKKSWHYLEDNVFMKDPDVLIELMNKNFWFALIQFSSEAWDNKKVVEHLISMINGVMANFRDFFSNVIKTLVYSKNLNKLFLTLQNEGIIYNYVVRFTIPETQYQTLENLCEDPGNLFFLHKALEDNLSFPHIHSIKSNEIHRQLQLRGWDLYFDEKALEAFAAAKRRLGDIEGAQKLFIRPFVPPSDLILLDEMIKNKGNGLDLEKLDATYKSVICRLSISVRSEHYSHYTVNAPDRDDAVHGHLYAQAAYIKLLKGSFSEAFHFYQIADNLPETVTNASFYLQAAIACLYAKDLSVAEKYFYKTVALSAKYSDKMYLLNKMAGLQIEIADRMTLSKNFDTAKSHYNRAEQIYIEVVENFLLDFIKEGTNKGLINESDGLSDDDESWKQIEFEMMYYQEADVYFSQALERLAGNASINFYKKVAKIKKRRGTDNSEFYSNAANAMAKQGNSEKAERYNKRAIERSKKNSDGQKKRKQEEDKDTNRSSKRVAVMKLPS